MLQVLYVNSCRLPTEITMGPYPVHPAIRLGENFTLNEFIKIINENKADLFWFGLETEV